MGSPLENINVSSLDVLTKAKAEIDHLMEKYKYLELLGLSGEAEHLIYYKLK